MLYNNVYAGTGNSFFIHHCVVRCVPRVRAEFFISKFYGDGAGYFHAGRVFNVGEF